MENKNVMMQRVMCRSIRETSPNQIAVGKEYMLDKASIWIDSDGDSYGVIYDNEKKVGQMKLSHFYTF